MYTPVDEKGPTKN